MKVMKAREWLLAYLASVNDDVGSNTLGAKFLFVISEQLDGLIVFEGALVVPHGRIDAGERDVLIRVLTQQTQESHLNDAHRLVRYLPGANNNNNGNSKEPNSAWHPVAISSAPVEDS